MLEKDDKILKAEKLREMLSDIKLAAKDFDITFEEITEIVEEVRQERFKKSKALINNKIIK